MLEGSQPRSLRACSRDDPECGARSATPRFGVGEAKSQTPGRKHAPRERGRLFVMTRWDHKRRSSPRKRGPMITAGGYGSRLSLRSAGTTIAWSARSTNLRVYEMTAGAIPLFPDCYLQ